MVKFAFVGDVMLVRLVNEALKRVQQHASLASKSPL